MELVKELIGNPAFRGHMQYEPVKVRNRKTGKRVFNEAWTANWWWDVQVKPKQCETLMDIKG